MNKIEILGAKETLYVEHLDNGLDIYMIPNNKVKNYYVTLNTKFGSIHTDFEYDGKDGSTIKAYAEEKGIEAQISLEERMACGIGACLACVCKTKEKDEHSNVNNKRICKDGPVFLSTEVDL